MRLTITIKLFLGLTLLCLAVVSAQALVTRWNFNRGLLAYVETKELAVVKRVVSDLAESYERESSWSSFYDRPRRWNDLLRKNSDRPDLGRPLDPPPRGRPGGGRQPPPPEGRRGAIDSLSFNRRLTLLDADRQIVVGTRPVSGSVTFPIQVAGANVGFVLASPLRDFEDPASQRFAEQQGRSLLLSASAALLLAALGSALLARQFNKPIRSLADATRVLTSGDFRARVAVRGDDELSLLAADVNMLAETLERNRESQRRWVTDIAHELRTPLAVLKGELEAIEDGVRTYDATTITSLNGELDRLIALVGELHTLTLSAESRPENELTSVELIAVVEQALAATAGRLADAGVQVDVQLPKSAWIIEGDADQLMQVFLNVLENAARYVNVPGTLVVTGEREADTVSLVFSDSGPGVPDRALTRLFDRLYRVDSSRNRQTGGSGLGLAICKAIVARHGGQISAAHADIGGLAIRLLFTLRSSP